MIILVILTCIITICTFLFWLIQLLLASFNHHNDLHSLSIIRLCLSILIPSYMSYSGIKRNSLSPTGACAAFLVGFIITLSSYSFMTSMLIFFYSASKATKWRMHLKKKLESDFKEGGQRNWVQVVCNGGVATQLAIIQLIETAGSNIAEAPINFSQFYLSSWFNVAFVACVACCCGDTFASEIGSVVGKSAPRLITTMKRVPRGTNGGISIVGLCASLFGGFIIGLTYFISTYFFVSTVSWTTSPAQWPIILVATASGLFGSLIDSILGATLQYSGLDIDTGKVVEYGGDGVRTISGKEIFNNDSVNLISSLLTALFIPHLAFYAWNFV